MANDLDELTGPVNEQGHDVNVIQKQIPVKVGVGSTIFEVLLWFPLIIPGVIFLFKKINAGSYLRQLQQKIQHDASTIDNYMEQRVNVLKNLAKLLDKSIDLDKDTFTKIAAYRSGTDLQNGEGSAVGDVTRNQVATEVENVARKINIAIEKYPDLEAHKDIEEAMQQNLYLQNEITAARDLYNDTINAWNRDINQWPVKMIVADKAGYTTRIPFSISKDLKEQARGEFF